MSEQTLAGWASANKRKGPLFVKLGGLVRYCVSDVERYLKQNTVRATNDGHDFTLDQEERQP